MPDNVPGTSLCDRCRELPAVRHSVSVLGPIDIREDHLCFACQDLADREPLTSRGEDHRGVRKTTFGVTDRTEPFTAFAGVILAGAAALMKSVLCYGDSITWGRNAHDGSRFPFEQRWPGVLQARLGNDYRIIEEGLGGRTVASDSWVLPHRDGRAMLGPILESHAPVDWVIIMLGMADCATTYHLSVSDIAFGVTTMLWNVAKSAAGPQGTGPQTLLISPPHLGKLSPFMELFYRGAEETNRGLASAYTTVAQSCGAHFLDAATVIAPSESDGVHPDANGHRRLGETIASLLGK